MKFSVNKKKKSNVYARNYGVVLCVYYIKWSMSEERNCLKDKHMLTLVDSEMVLYCKFALDGLILIDVCSVSFFNNLQKWVPYSITVFQFTYILLIQKWEMFSVLSQPIKGEHMMIFMNILMVYVMTKGILGFVFITIYFNAIMLPQI